MGKAERRQGVIAAWVEDQRSVPYLIHRRWTVADGDCLISGELVWPDRKVAAMTDVIGMIDPVTGEIIDEQQLAEQLLKQAKEQGVDLIGPDGLLNGLTKRVLGVRARGGDDRASRIREARVLGWRERS
jgi:hypothetical protein